VLPQRSSAPARSTTPVRAKVAASRAYGIRFTGSSGLGFLGRDAGAAMAKGAWSGGTLAGPTSIRERFRLRTGRRERARAGGEELEQFSEGREAPAPAAREMLGAADEGPTPDVGAAAELDDERPLVRKGVEACVVVHAHLPYAGASAVS